MRETVPPPSLLSKGKYQEYPGPVSSEMKLDVDKKFQKDGHRFPHAILNRSTL